MHIIPGSADPAALKRQFRTGASSFHAVPAHPAPNYYVFSQKHHTVPVNQLTAETSGTELNNPRRSAAVPSRSGNALHQRHDHISRRQPFRLGITSPHHGRVRESDGRRSALPHHIKKDRHSSESFLSPANLRLSCLTLPFLNSTVTLV